MKRGAGNCSYCGGWGELLTSTGAELGDCQMCDGEGNEITWSLGSFCPVLMQVQFRPGQPWPYATGPRFRVKR